MASVIQYDYDFSPYGQKTRLLLHVANIPYAIAETSILLPRPALEALGITYRRIPVLAIGKDVYVDTSKIIDTALSTLGKLGQSPADKAFQIYGDNLFAEALSLIPLELLTPDFVKDRETVFPALSRPDLKTLRPSGLAQFKARLTEIETQFLSGSGPFINGSKISLADVHVFWPIRWTLQDLGLNKEPGIDAATFPKVFKVVESLPQPADVKAAAKSVTPEEAHKLVTEGQYTAKTATSVQDDGTYGIPAGTTVAIESFDSAPGSHPQYGKLVGTGIDEVVIETDSGVRVHFPKIGYIVRKLEDAPAKLKL